MGQQKEIEEFLELDKDEVELVEGIASCSFEAGRVYGQLSGECVGWSEAVGLAITLHNLGKIDDKVLAKFTDRFLKAHAADQKKRGAKALLKGTETLKRAGWAVLKRRLKRLRAP